jgi:hypothetical protein
MRRKSWLAGLLLGLAASSWAMAAELFVSPSGNDANPGTRDQPLQTLAAAQKMIRTSKAGEPRSVTLQGGTYYLPETLVFTAEDSGTKSGPAIWQAAPGQPVVISGGQKLDLKWTPYKDGILRAQVPAGTQTDQLFINGQRQILARYPNFDPNVDIFNGYAADCISPARVARWADPAGGIMHAMHPAQWGGFSYLITGKDGRGGVTLQGGWQGNRAAEPHKTFRYVENIFEELDAPGEWFLNTKTSTLYFDPPAGTDMATAHVEVVKLRHLVEFRGTQRASVKWLTLSGMTFRQTARTFMETKEPLLRSDWTIYRGGAIFFDGAEDCTLQDSFLDQLGGNAVFVNNYNRRVAVRGCRIDQAGAGGIMFVGDPKAVRNPLLEYGQRQALGNIDRTPGPQTDNYPADCRVEDCLITRAGRVEKQATGVGMDMAARITVSHCSIYDMPRAGINIGDGCWGGHVIEFCDIFDTVTETGDHGSFNSWGRDRYWNLQGLDPNTVMLGANKDVPLLDNVQTNILRNNRWRCDHGWDIDLDDGSTNYHIYNNLCLNGGIKNREGFRRVVENNIMVNNTFHPHVWYKDSEDSFAHNIVFAPYQPVRVPQPWGKQVDENLLHDPAAKTPAPATELQALSGRDEHSIKADAMFVDPAAGDYTVKDGSPALALGFKNFPMDQFGVQKLELKAIARTPSFAIGRGTNTNKRHRVATVYTWLGAKVRNIVGMGEMSAHGLPGETGVLVLEMPANGALSKAGLQKDDVILGLNGDKIDQVKDLPMGRQAPIGNKPFKLVVSREQKEVTLAVAP